MENLPVEPKQKCCTCGLCFECANSPIEVTYRITPKVKERFLTKAIEETAKRAVMDAINHCLLLEEKPDTTLEYSLVYAETCMKLIHDMVTSRITTARKKANLDPKTVAEFKAALLKAREAKGKRKSTKVSTREPKEKKVTLATKYKTDDLVEKNIITALFQAEKSKILTMALPMIAQSNPTYDVNKIAQRMGLKVN